MFDIGSEWSPVWKLGLFARDKIKSSLRRYVNKKADNRRVVHAESSRHSTNSRITENKAFVIFFHCHKKNEEIKGKRGTKMKFSLLDARSRNIPMTYLTRGQFYSQWRFQLCISVEEHFIAVHLKILRRGTSLNTNMSRSTWGYMIKHPYTLL